MKPPAEVSAEICVAIARMPEGRIDDMKLWPSPISLSGAAARRRRAARARSTLQLLDGVGFGVAGDEAVVDAVRRPGLPFELVAERLAHRHVAVEHQHVGQSDGGLLRACSTTISGGGGATMFLAT